MKELVKATRSSEVVDTWRALMPAMESLRSSPSFKKAVADAARFAEEADKPAFQEALATLRRFAGSSGSA